MIARAIIAAACTLGAAWLITRDRDGWGLLFAIAAIMVWS